MNSLGLASELGELNKERVRIFAEDGRVQEKSNVMLSIVASCVGLWEISASCK